MKDQHPLGFKCWIIGCSCAVVLGIGIGFYVGYHRANGEWWGLMTKYTEKQDEIAYEAAENTKRTDAQFKIINAFQDVHDHHSLAIDRLEARFMEGRIDLQAAYPK